MSWSSWPTLADPDAVLVLDETGFVKKGTKREAKGKQKGTKSVGVAPQYCGTVGKIANCQMEVFLAYVTRSGPVLLDRELYLPREWADDLARREEAGVPADARCLPKPTLGTQLLERTFARGVQAAWVTADSIYGGAYKLRHYLEEREQPFVLAVHSTQRVGLCAKAERVVASWPAEAWSRLSAGEGSQGPRWYDWGWMPISWRDAPAGMARLVWPCWLLAQRSVSKPDELAYYFVFGPADVTLERRWSISPRSPAPAGGGASLRAGQG